MPILSGGQAAVEALKVEQTKYVFGLIGSATMEMFDALYDAPEIKLIGVRDERTGTHMADGYARASGKAGVVLAGQNGPGATNLVTGLAQAAAAFSPIVSIAGSISSEHLYRDGFQEVNQQGLFSNITKKTWTVTHTARIPEMFREAFRHALSPRTGPVHLNLPRDILSAQAEFASLQQPAEYRGFHRPFADNDAIKKATAMLMQASRPVIIVGGGIKNSRATADALTLAETLQAPLVSAPGHGDALPYDHAFNAGQMGPRGNKVASHLVNEADVILALGTRLGFNSTFYSYDNINQNAKIIQIELEPTAIGRYFPIALGIWADASHAAQQLSAEITQTRTQANASAQQWFADYEQARKIYRQARDDDADTTTHPTQPSGLFKSLRAVLPRNSAFTMDAGTLCLQATDAMNYYETPSLFTPLDFGLVGFSFACGLGVKLAMPERPVISMMGDGGFGMTLSELSTAVEYGINTVTLVMNNQCWGAEKAYQRDFFDGRYIGADIQSPPFDKLAELYGAKGFKAETLNDVSGAVEAALQCGKPAVVDIAVDPDALYSFRRDSFKHRAK